MMRTMAILGVLMSQAMSACGPGTMVLCVHQSGRAHVEFGSGTCCHETGGRASCGRVSCRCASSGHAIHATHALHTHPATLNHEDEGSFCTGHLASPATLVDCFGDESGPCTDYPLVISQLRSAQQRGMLLAADSLPCIDALSDHLPALSASTRNGCGAFRAVLVSPVLTALSTVVLRC
jgi:hypothetical protein